MKHLPTSRYPIAAFLLACGIVGCANRVIPRTPAPEAEPVIATDKLIQVKPLPMEPEYRNQWTPELETEFWMRANEAIEYYAGKSYGNTHGGKREAVLSLSYV